MEIRLLCDAVLSAEFITGNKSRELVDNLCGSLSENQGAEIKKQLFLENRKKEKNEEIYYNIDKIQRAISEKQENPLHLPPPQGSSGEVKSPPSRRNSPSAPMLCFGRTTAIIS